MRRRTRGRRSLLGLAPGVLVLGFLVAGCGADNDPGAADRDRSTPSASAPGSTAAPSPPSATPATPAVTPASGDLVTLTTLSFRLPVGWRVDAGDRGSASAFDSGQDAAHGGVQVFDQASFGGETVDSEARIALGTARRDGMSPTRQADLTVDGVPGYVVTGADQTYPVYYVFGTVTRGHDVTLLFRFQRSTPAAQPTIDSVLASVTWS